MNLSPSKPPFGQTPRNIRKLCGLISSGISLIFTTCLKHKFIDNFSEKVKAEGGVMTNTVINNNSINMFSLLLFKSAVPALYWN